jgi:hypothetical protein
MFNNKLSRKSFLKLSSLGLLGLYFNSCKKIDYNNSIAISYAGLGSKRGHLLRNTKFPTPTNNIKINTLIVGGGVAGLSAARYLNKSEFDDWLLIEMDTDLGGNSKSGANNISQYPLGAHYLPIPNNEFVALCDFLNEHKIILGYDNAGLPIYNEYFLCAAPEERLNYKGLWQEGLLPKSGLSEMEFKEISRFFELTNYYSQQIGEDGKPAFTIPIEMSSMDKKYRKLDDISMLEFLTREKYNSDFLFWYINYCCKDDYGTEMKNTSAWAGMHYFSSRRGKASNANRGEQLTWPEGNNFLVKCLQKNLNSKIQSDSLAYKIEKVNDRWHCFVMNLKTNSSSLYICKNIILATPQFANQLILPESHRSTNESFNYFPWLVANISIRNKFELNGAFNLAWDNVIYDSKSLGYVNACHQNISNGNAETVITYYYNFSQQDAQTERKQIHQKDKEYWKNFIINDLKKTHKNIEENIEKIELSIYGHGMISPEPGFLNSALRNKLAQGLDGIFFAHSDVSGISIFEQAFYRGCTASQQALNRNQST